MCMSDEVFRRESPVEFFKELVDGALAHQRLEANELTAYYVVQLLASYVERPVRADEQMRTAGAAARPGARIGRHAAAREPENKSATCLCSSPASSPILLNRKLVDADYYVSIGGCAHGGA